MKLIDKYRREHKYLRLSLTDRCNLQCIYCNPDSSKQICTEKSSLLTFEELERLVRIFVIGFDFDKVRLTGGEPFARKGVADLISMLGRIKSEKPFELTATTNGTLLDGKITALKNTGIDRLNFSLDSLNPENFKRITGSDGLNKVLKSIVEAEAAGLTPVKINSVIMRGKNEHEIFDFVEFAVRTGINIRFIEYMPFSANYYSDNMFISSNEIKMIVEEKYSLNRIEIENSLVSKDYMISGTNSKLSFISSISEHFCDSCDRIRITADGKIKTCLFSVKDNESDLKAFMRSSRSDDEIKEFIENALTNKSRVHPDLHELKLLKNNDMLKIGG